MEIEYAFLCRYAESNPDGTFDTIGTGFTFVRARSYPNVIPVMVILKLKTTGPARELDLAVSVVGPTGDTVLSATLTLNPVVLPENVSLTPPNTASVVLNLGPMPLLTAGKYVISIAIGKGDESTSIALPLQAMEVEL